MSTMRDRLADHYLQHLERHIDHGLDEPRGGGFSIVKDLKEDLDEEQAEILGEQDAPEFWRKASEGDLAKNRTSVNMAQMVVDQVFFTSDLYQEMADANDVATAERSAILRVESPSVMADGTEYLEHYYSATVTYHIDVAAFLASIGVSKMYVDEIAASLELEYDRFVEYLNRNGARDLLDKWLPGRQSNLDYELKWNISSLKYSSFARLDISFKVAERWLTEAVRA